jgi:LysM repeat protein
MKKSWVLGGAGAIVLALAIVCVAAVALVYVQARTRALKSRPLVLILSPVNHEQVRAGDGVVVHATARSKGGVNRVEFWADGELLAVRDREASGPVSPLMLTASWQSDSPGSHVLLVRAIAADGAEGQATVAIETVGESQAALGGHVVAEGETLESIADEYGVSPEELEALNPDLDPGRMAPGDEWTVPGGAGAGEELPGEGGVSEPPTSGGEEPAPHDGAPGGLADVVDDMGMPEDWIRHARLAGETLSLRIEALSLQTDAAYEALHCYIGLGGNPPRWYPDADGDQATDESFGSLSDGRWDAAQHLGGESALVIPWPGDQSISIDASCVGVLGSGTEAVELGRLVMDIPPEAWDGVARQSPEVSAEGSFSLEYRVGPADEESHGIPIWLDETMTRPTDLQLQPRGFGLWWQYRLGENEEPIDGFRIYLNETLLWVEPPDSRTTDLPREWLFPPCGESFTFTVTAFREGYPDGPESRPSDPPVIIESDPERCGPRWTAAFLTLTTQDLGGDGRYEDRSGDVGPAYGYFYANDEQVSFDGRNESWGGLGLNHNSQYGVDDLTASANWAGSGPAQFRIELAEDEALTLGFHIDEENTGRCHDSDDPGCDDLVCEGDVTFFPSLTASDEGAIQSRAGQGYCEVSYTLVPAWDSPAVEAGGGVPLPWLVVEDVAIGEANQVRVHVRNSGAASWASRDLTVELLRPTGESIASQTWPGFSLAPEETAILADPVLVAQEPVCVLLDPDREVAQEIDGLESLGVLSRRPVCMDLPDLVITGVEYDPEGGRELVTVQNQGDGTLDFRSVGLTVDPIDEDVPGALSALPGIYLDSGGTVVLSLSSSFHSRWFDGYTVTVDPDDEIAETENGNNSFTVSGGAHLELEVDAIEVPYPARNRTEFQILASARSAGTSRPLVDWTIQTDDVDPFYCDRQFGCTRTFIEDEYHTEFDIAGDETLWITIFANLERAMEDDWGHTFTWMSAAWDFTGEDNWGAGGFDPVAGCTMIDAGPGNHGWVLGRFIQYDVTEEDQPWVVGFNLCTHAGG